ncbi:MAG: hypothetical protein ACEQSX_01975 [Baekduiaceae bacterium]
MSLAPRYRHLAVLLSMVLAVALSASSAHAQDPVGEDTPPILLGGSLSPSVLEWQGDQVTITVDAIDDFGITMAYADVTNSNGFRESVQLIPSGPTSYTGLIMIAPNPTDQPLTYGVEVTVTDGNGGFDTEVIGEIQVDAQPQFDEAPAVSDPTVSPRALPSGSGPVTIAATATDNRSIASVSATVRLPGGGTSEVPLEAISASRFEGTYTPPANTGTTAQRYAIEITASDDIGQTASVDAGEVVVAARAAVAGRLVVPAWKVFGPTAVGRVSTQSVVLRHGGPATSAPITGVVAQPAAPFSVVGADTSGLPFTLLPGETKTVAVQFRPRAAGLHSRTLVVRRTDGQRGGSVVLTGFATPGR